MTTRLIYLQDTDILSTKVWEVTTTIPYNCYIDFGPSGAFKNGNLVFTNDIETIVDNTVVRTPSDFPARVNNLVGAGSMDITTSDGSFYGATPMFATVNLVDALGNPIKEVNLPLPIVEASTIVVPYRVTKVAHCSIDGTLKTLRLKYKPLITSGNSYYMANGPKNSSLQDYFAVRNLDSDKIELPLYGDSTKGLSMNIYEKAVTVFRASLPAANSPSTSDISLIQRDLIAWPVGTRIRFTNQGSYGAKATLGYRVDYTPINAGASGLTGVGDNSGNEDFGFSNNTEAPVMYYSNQGDPGHAFYFFGQTIGNGDEILGKGAGFNTDTKKTVAITVLAGESIEIITNNLPIVYPKLSITTDPDNALDALDHTADLVAIGSVSINCIPSFIKIGSTFSVNRTKNGTSIPVITLDETSTDKSWITYLQAFCKVKLELRDMSAGNGTYVVLDSREDFGDLQFTTAGAITTTSKGHTFYNIPPEVTSYNLLYTITEKTL